VEIVSRVVCEAGAMMVDGSEKRGGFVWLLVIDASVCLCMTYARSIKCRLIRKVNAYFLRPRKSVVLGFSDIVFDRSSYSKILYKL
jgi:hypothetical protein